MQSISEEAAEVSRTVGGRNVERNVMNATLALSSAPLRNPRHLCHLMADFGFISEVSEDE